MTESILTPLEKLRIADPDTFVWVKGRVVMLTPAPSRQMLDVLTQETIWGLAQEPGLGRAVAEGLLHLFGKGRHERVATYLALVHKAAETGATLGRLVASFAAPVLEGSDQLLSQFEKSLSIMLEKGTYTLSAPMEVLVVLIAENAFEAAGAYLELLQITFKQPITYNQSLRLVYLLPKAVRSFAPQRRLSQIHTLTQLAGVDLQLVDPFLDGMERGLALLDDHALPLFVDQALQRFGQTPEKGIKFLSLASKIGQDACAALQRAVPLNQVKSRLARYLNARIGRPVVVQPLSDLPTGSTTPFWVVSDGRFIYVPDEIDLFERQHQNEVLYKALVRLEAGYLEYHSFDFDLERAADTYSDVAQWVHSQNIPDADGMLCDGERFVAAFYPQSLAQDLFTLYEQARVAANLRRHYPGMMRQVRPVMSDAARRQGLFKSDHILGPAFIRLVLNSGCVFAKNPSLADCQQRLINLFTAHIKENSPVEFSAFLVCLAFEQIRHFMGRKLNSYQPMNFPYGRRIHWDLVSRSFSTYEKSALRIKIRLKDNNLNVYRTDLRNRLEQRQGILTAEDIVELVLTRTNSEPDPEAALQLSQIDFAALLQQSGLNLQSTSQDHSDAVRYREWDYQLQDYLHDHVYVYERPVYDDGHGDFYGQTIWKHQGLVSRMRRAFELLKPEGMTILRQWPEGDAFDYRALLDFAIDRRCGRIPSDRLFIKRLKQERDVAVLLLVDLSRSTANPVAGGHTSVLGVAKEALVLFCEALQVVGDDFAITGFSGTGRHAVDFYKIKNFQESLSESIKSRISALSPQRSTRMGAAIRHATSLLTQAASKVRLMIIVSDGFPNDLGYKAEYAIADTRRAVQEARARNFHVKAITVNIGSDPRLDDLYGRVHHHVIGDVRELPNKLLRLYGTLTRF